MSEKLYLVAYDVVDTKRLAKVRRLVYSYALGGQKSAMELPLSRVMLKELVDSLMQIIKDDDKINIVQIGEKPLLFGKADFITYNKGVIVV